MKFEIDPWATGVLKPGVHDSLVKGLAGYAADAGIPASYVWSVTEDHLKAEEELSWVTEFKSNRLKGYCGLIYVGLGFDPTIETRMCAIAGKLTRNFIRARMMTLESALPSYGNGDFPAATCLLLPTFVDAKPDGKKASLVPDLLLSRFAADKSQTVLYASGFGAIRKAYGSFVCDHIKAHYVQVKGTKKGDDE